MDVNNLKVINDAKDHQAGDQYLIDACRIICNIFKHSPVYRLGGDEFAVISEDQDFDRIDELIENVNTSNHKALRSGVIVIACGMAKYEGEDNVGLVFEKADQLMYENKSYLKTLES